MTAASAGSAEHLRKIKLTTAELKMLGYLAEHGGEIDWDWSKISPLAKAMIANMMNSGLVIDREYTTHAGVTARVTLRMTDQGRAAYAAIEKMQVGKAS